MGIEIEMAAIGRRCERVQPLDYLCTAATRPTVCQSRPVIEHGDFEKARAGRIGGKPY